MAKAFGIINTTGNHIWVEGMQDYRPIGAFSFLGRYRLIDFPMSNFSNSDIDRIQKLADLEKDDSQKDQDDDTDDRQKFIAEIV